MAVTAKIQQTINMLTDRMRDALSSGPGWWTGQIAVPQAAGALLSAMENGRITFEREPWHDLSNRATTTTPAELLLRARDENAAPLSLGDAMTQINESGVYALFDTAIVLAAFDQALAENAFPVSINISSRNAEDYDAMTGLHKMLRAHFGDRLRPDQIIFELLEDDRAANVSVEAMDYMTGMGYRFALDDITHSAFDADRLNNLGPYASFVKIDGQLLDGIKNGSNSLNSILDRASQAAPNARILCEWVASAEEADQLRLMFPEIALVQGRELGQDTSEFSRRLRDAEQYSPHRYGPFLKAG